jgi:predicted MFS family arabinose efflux permease
MKQACRATRFIFLAFGMSMASWVPMVPFIKSRLGLDDAQFGLLLFLCGIGTSFVLPLSCWLVKRFGSSFMIGVSGLVAPILLPLLTIAPNLFSLCIALVLLGGAHSVMGLAMNAQAIAAESRSHQSLMSSFHCLFSVGNFLGVLLIGLLLEFNLSFFYCGVLISILIALIITFQWKKLLPDEAPTDVLQAPAGMIEGRVLLLGFLYLIAFISEGCMSNWSAEFFSSSLNYSTAHAGIGYVIFSMAMTGGRLLGDRIISRFGQIMTFRMSCLLGATGFIILMAARWPYGELIGCFLVGLGSSNIVPILLSLSGKFPKTTPHHALSIVTYFGHLGSLIGPLLVGFIANAFSLAFAFGCIAALLFVMGLFGSPLALKSSRNSL